MIQIRRLVVGILQAFPPFLLLFHMLWTQKFKLMTQMANSSSYCQHTVCWQDDRVSTSSYDNPSSSLPPICMNNDLIVTDKGVRLACRCLSLSQNRTHYLPDQLEWNEIDSINYTSNPPPCEDVELLILVLSGTKNFMKRAAIRHTWKKEFEKSSKVLVYFVVGETMDDKISKEVHNESLANNDIILLQQVDSYARISLKTLQMYRWMRDYCKTNTHFMKADDDTVINPFIYDKIKFELMSQQSQDIYGVHHIEARPVRETSLSPQWSIPTSFYPLQHFPDYLNGPGILLSRQTVLKFLDILPMVPFMPGIEDQLFAGIVAALSGGKPVGYFRFHGPLQPERGFFPSAWSWVAGESWAIENHWEYLLKESQ